MPHELPNELRLRSTSSNYYLVLSLAPENKMLSVVVKICRKTETELLPQYIIPHDTRVSIKYFVNDCLCNSFLLLTFPDLLKFGLFDPFCNPKAFGTAST